LNTQDKIRYGSIQIELTSRCTLRCVTCLRSSHAGLWQERDLSIAAFSSLQNIFKNTEGVHLQGWGESLMLQNLDAYITIAKKYGCRVSFTTNGSFMDVEMATRLIRSGVDGITFSMAGGSGEVQDPLRGKKSFEKLDASLSILADVKKKLHSVTPIVAISYLLTPATIIDLSRAVGWCGKRGVSLFAGVHLTHAADKTQQSLQLFPVYGNKYKWIIRRACLQALLAGIQLKMPSLVPSLLPVCSKNPIHNLSIAADGSVAPCVFLNAPMAQSANWMGQGAGSSPVHFGNITTEPLNEIWNSELYQDFRNCFMHRVTIYQQALARVGYDMDGIEQLERAKEQIRETFSHNPPPEPCADCTKLVGY